jgi:hypothetical protein
MPRLGDVFADVRDDGRVLRVSFHGERGTVVVSLWHDTLCRGSFQLRADELDRLISTLTAMRLATPATADDPGGATPAGVNRAATAPEPGESPLEQTGDITGTAGFGRRASAPVLRVA